MKNFFERLKKNVIYVWGVSYIVILLIPIITIFINYHFNVRVIRKEIIDGNRMVLNNLSDRVDEYLNENMTLYSNISMNESFKDWILNQEKDSYFYKDTYNFMKQIAINFSNNSKHSCLLYFVDLDYMLNPIGSTDMDSYYQALKFYNSDVPNLEEWYRVVSKQYSNDYLVMDFMHHKTVLPCIVLANTILYSQNKVNIFVGFPINEIETLVKDMDPETKLLVTVGNEPLLLIVDGKTVPNTQMSSLEEILDENEYVIIHKQSDNEGLAYYLMIPENIFWVEAQHTRNVLVVSIVLMLIIGIICIFFLLRHNYRPISELLIKVTGGYERSGNEYAKMEEVFIKLKEQNTFMNKKICDLKEDVQKNKLLAMMKGRKVKDDAEKVFRIEDNQASFMIGFMLPFPEKGYDELDFFVIDNIFSELMNGENFFKVEDGQYLFYLFLVGENEENWKTYCFEKLNFLVEMLKEKGYVDLVAVISGKERREEGIINQYNDIMDAFEYAQVVGEKEVIDAEILAISDMKTMHFKMGTIIGNELRNRDYVKVMECAEKFYLISSQVSFILFRMQILEIFLTVTTVFFELEIAEEARTYLLSYLEPLVAIKSREEAKRLLDDVLKYVCGVICIQEQSSEDRIVTFVKEYVENHYAEEALSINMIADSIGLSPKHVGRVFKCNNGEGIPDYINRVRIAKAQILLRNGNYSVEEVGRNVGYASAKTFRRAFVKLHDVTPGRYEKEDV